MITYSIIRNGALFFFNNRAMAQRYVELGRIVTMYKNGKKIYTMCPIDKKD